MSISLYSPTVPPSPPLNVAFSEVNADGALVTWDPPLTDGGDAISQYYVVSVRGQGSSFSLNVPGTQTNVR